MYNPNVINHSIIRCNARAKSKKKMMGGSGFCVESRVRKTATLVICTDATTAA